MTTTPDLTDDEPTGGVPPPMPPDMSSVTVADLLGPACRVTVQWSEQLSKGSQGQAHPCVITPYLLPPHTARALAKLLVEAAGVAASGLVVARSPSLSPCNGRPGR